MMKTGNFAAIAMAASVLGAGLAAPQIASAQPNLSVAQEAAAHPRLVKAIRDAEGALRMLAAAPDDFGGNKGQAMSDLRAAVHCLRKALFYRMRMDDAAIDRARF